MLQMHMLQGKAACLNPEKPTGWPAVALKVPSGFVASAEPKAPTAAAVDGLPLVPLTCRVLPPPAASVVVRLPASKPVPLMMTPAW